MPFENVLIWWSMLLAASFVNIYAWMHSYKSLSALDPNEHASMSRFRKIQALLSAGYVLGCAYRCAFPVFDIARQGMVDSALSSAFVGRSVATIAELCFAAQWALLAGFLARSSHSRVGIFAGKAIFPMILVAEVFSWYSVLSTSNFGHIFEETLWGLAAALAVAAFWDLRSHCAPKLRTLLAFWAYAGAAYAAYMFWVDVPMYAQRWFADEAQGKSYLSIARGAADAFHTVRVTHAWSDWKSEIVWMSLYFSVAVWISIALIHIPHHAPKASGSPPEAS